jgi:serine acetyltransferase
MNYPGLLIRGWRAIRSRSVNVWYRALGVKINGYVELQHVEIPRNWCQIELHGPSCLDHGVTLIATGPAAKQPKIMIGAGVYVNRYTVIDAHQLVTIGRRCMIGPHCYITDADHGTRPGQPIAVQPMTIAPVRIDDGAWIGANVSVLKGVTIGRGAVVGAGSVVTRDIPANAIAVGVPARTVGYRHAEEAPLEISNLDKRTTPLPK